MMAVSCVFISHEKIGQKRNLNKHAMFPYICIQIFLSSAYFHLRETQFLDKTTVIALALYDASSMTHGWKLMIRNASFSVQEQHRLESELENMVLSLLLVLIDTAVQVNLNKWNSLQPNLDFVERLGVEQPGNQRNDTRPWKWIRL